MSEVKQGVLEPPSYTLTALCLSLLIGFSHSTHIRTGHSGESTGVTYNTDDGSVVF